MSSEVPSSTDEALLRDECARHLASPAGHTFLRMLRIRRTRRMHAAATAPNDSFLVRKGAYQELDSLIRDLEKAQDK